MELGIEIIILMFLILIPTISTLEDEAGNVITFDYRVNYTTLYVNRSDYWDDLDSPSDISHADLSDLGWSVAGHIMDADFLPDASLTYDIGSGALRWGTLYTSIVNSESIDNLNNISTGGYFIGSGAYLNELNVTGNITSYGLNISFLYGNEGIGSMDLRGDPWYLSGTDLAVDGDIMASTFIGDLIGNADTASYADDAGYADYTIYSATALDSDSASGGGGETIELVGGVWVSSERFNAASFGLADNLYLFLGTGDDTEISFDGEDLIINSNGVTANDEVHFTNFDKYTFDNDLIVEGHAVTFGDNTANDIVLTFDGSANDGALTFDESDGEFSFNKNIEVSDTVDSYGRLIKLIKTNYNLATATNAQYVLDISARASTNGAKALQTLFLDTRITGNNAAQTGAVYGGLFQVYDTTDQDVTGTVAGTRTFVANAGGGTHSEVIGSDIRIENENNENGGINVVRGVKVAVDAEDGTIGTGYGIYIDSPQEDGGTFTTWNGLWMNDATKATTNRGIVIDSDTIGLTLGGGQDVNLLGSSDGFSMDSNLFIDGNINQTGGNSTINNFYGEMWNHSHEGVPLNFAFADTWYPLFFTDAGELNGFGFSGGHMTTSNLTSQKQGVYKASYDALGDGVNNHEYLTTIFVNGARIEKCETHKKMNAGGDIVTMSGNCLLRLEEGDNVSLWTQDMGGTGIGNYYGGNLNLIRVGN